MDMDTDMAVDRAGTATRTWTHRDTDRDTDMAVTRIQTMTQTGTQRQGVISHRNLVSGVSYLAEVCKEGYDIFQKFV
jgi:hypothetical protein